MQRTLVQRVLALVRVQALLLIPSKAWSLSSPGTDIWWAPISQLLGSLSQHEAYFTLPFHFSYRQWKMKEAHISSSLKIFTKQSLLLTWCCIRLQCIQPQVQKKLGCVRVINKDGQKWFANLINLYFIHNGTQKRHYMLKMRYFTFSFWICWQQHLSNNLGSRQQRKCKRKTKKHKAVGTEIQQSGKHCIHKLMISILKFYQKVIYHHQKIERIWRNLCPRDKNENQYWNHVIISKLIGTTLIKNTTVTDIACMYSGTPLETIVSQHSSLCHPQMQVKPLLSKEVQIQRLQKQVPDLYGPLKEDELVHRCKHGPVTTCLGQGCDMLLLSDSKWPHFILNLYIFSVYTFAMFFIFCCE